jgi:hypothetical protein
MSAAANVTWPPSASRTPFEEFMRAGTMARSHSRTGSLNRRTNPTIWRDDIDALVFTPEDHHGLCMVHRRALRTLLRFDPAPRDCQVLFRANESAFRAAASAKIVREKVAGGVNFHLTSRDIARAMKK